MSTKPVIQGSCACRYVRYTVSQLPSIVVNCHCTECRKQSGAPYQSWAHFHRDAINWIVQPTTRRSSNIATRSFCPRCGSSITMAYDVDPEMTGIAAGTIDDDASIPDQVPKPGFHIFLKEKAAWFDIPEDGAERWDSHPPRKGWDSRKEITREGL
ncbi:hypothetical protein ASPWEDRAFT_167470 [Aspergillus wentii DTO 134E9]|uniref:CENP-V/GFA domain-containing protein n=1 Tax=Aspergillus wentii DTO 134E9 TaxID=1073089 RepID=A0A1L9S2Q9_ASPWE|nr:uncharacterized protein ASPWEDRAFT_167470 [Aspergillus wentii DTO 134E9]OJJ41455.1 hypothetical protein ASPWEDRAFT_167470 [Aspergillus wentii DTO 134E9]